ncbi:uncharacterized protein N7473_008781 [Penicillium subrubescens]|uniref:uncharacterized protein n=1 Tax=Penicillium subrubescens TaxID=1316194 RepID=UPI002545AAF1|nr:uncharacterized protein N7473_008781 [Penicillium subrubescens]KAJ5886107.1 hypothetical protein N7473_008781 [Penicillium subrubescens]
MSFLPYNPIETMQTPPKPCSRPPAMPTSPGLQWQCQSQNSKSMRIDKPVIAAAAKSPLGFSGVDIPMPDHRSQA